MRCTVTNITRNNTESHKSIAEIDPFKHPVVNRTVLIKLSVATKHLVVAVFSNYHQHSLYLYHHKL
jgi:hypothetical protein